MLWNVLSFPVWPVFPPSDEETMTLNIKIIEPTGILDSTQANSFRQQVDKALEEGVHTLLIDLKNITFVDSSGLGILVVIFKKVRAAQKKMYVCSINEQVRMLFELTSMDRVFEVLPDRASFEEKIAGVTKA
jgi:anti-anti-sigma factor